MLNMRIADRIAIVVSLIYCGIAVIASGAAWFLIEKGFSEEVGKQQFATLDGMIGNIDRHLEWSQAVMHGAARTLTPEIAADPRLAQAWLDGRTGMATAYQNGVVLASPSGHVLAQSRFLQPAKQLDISTHPEFQNAIATLKPQVAETYMGSPSGNEKTPAVMVTLPILDRQGTPFAVLRGSIDLLGSDFLGHPGMRGTVPGSYYVLVSKQRVILAHPNKSRVLAEMAAGENDVLDRALSDGFQGTGERQNYAGVSVLTSVRPIPSLPWVLMLSYPRDEAMASLRPFRIGLPLIVFAATLLAAFFARKIVRRQLRPLALLSDHVAALPEKSGDERFIPPLGVPDLALLAQSFNQMLNILDEKNARLIASEQLYRTLAEFSSDFVFWRDVNGALVYVSGKAYQLTGYTEAQFLECPQLLDEIVLAEDRSIWEEHTHKTDEHGWSIPITFRIRHASGEIRWVSHVCHEVVGDDGRSLGVKGSHRDITAKKADEDRLQLAASVFYSARESIMVTNAKGEIEAVNPAFVAMTGYNENDAQGKTPRLLKSGRHGEGFYREMWTTLTQHGCWQGDVWNRRKNGDIYVASSHIEAVTDSHGTLTHYICGQTDITTLKDVESRMEFLSSHDPLTGMANRSALEQLGKLALSNAHGAGRESTVMFVDLDRFKEINESMGHGVGDAILVQLAKRLQALCRGTDILARIGGDEFALIFAGVERHTAQALAEKVLRGVREPFSIGDHDISLSVSIGIAVHPHDGDNISELLKNADSALSRAKLEDRNTVLFYNRSMNQATFGQLLLETELRKAVLAGELVTYYQPKIDFQTGIPVGAEALVRWRHPVKGMISPGEFIPVAERSGLIHELGDWVLSDVCRQLSEWRDAGRLIHPVAVNVSARQFRTPGLPSRVQSLLELHRLPPRMLELELTETTLLIAGHQVMENISELHKMGVTLAIDDFGTGYSSLSYLKRMPIDVLKVDQSFVRELETSEDDQALVTSIVALGHSLGLKVVAEGVETAAQAALLDERGCDIAQGYLYARPMPAESYLTWLVDAKLTVDCFASSCRRLSDVDSELIQ